MNEIKFRAWDGERLRKVNTIGWVDEGVDFVTTPRYSGPAEDFRLMQYTGLKDKNGVEIYEGDILYFEPYETHGNDRVVEYIDGAYHGKLVRSGYSKLLAECVYETKVIGNIYENPELSEREAK